MILTNKKLVFGIIVVLVSLIYGYISFERFFTEEETKITIINSEKFGNEPGRYLVFTKDEVFENVNNYYHQKYNADELDSELINGKTYKVKVAGYYIPFIPRFRNIIEIVKENLPGKNIK